MQILTTHNPKILKNAKYGWKSFGVHLAPDRLSGKNMCPSSSKGCRESCLNTAGQGTYDRVQSARIRKTIWFIENRMDFLQNLKREIAAKVNTAKRTGQKVSVRLNMTSDILWENVKIDGKNLMEHFPTVMFMDYTKHPDRMLKFITGQLPKNYHLTFSSDRENETACKIISACGGNLAVVFDKKLPKTFMGKRVIDGTKHDLRFLDKKNVIVGLVALGKAKKDKTGFVVRQNTKS